MASANKPELPPGLRYRADGRVEDVSGKQLSASEVRKRMAVFFGDEAPGLWKRGSKGPRGRAG